MTNLLLVEYILLLFRTHNFFYLLAHTYSRVQNFFSDLTNFVVVAVTLTFTQHFFIVMILLPHNNMFPSEERRKPTAQHHASLLATEERRGDVVLVVEVQYTFALSPLAPFQECAPLAHNGHGKNITFEQHVWNFAYTGVLTYLFMLYMYSCIKILCYFRYALCFHISSRVPKVENLWRIEEKWVFENEEVKWDNHRMQA